MLPALIAVGFLEGWLPRPWNVIGAGLVAVFWTVALVAQGNVALSDREAVAGATALALGNAFVGMIVAVRFRGILLRAVRAT